MIKFTTDVNHHLKEGEMIVIYEGDFLDDSPRLQAWDNEGPYATVTQFLMEHPSRNGWANIHHDVISTNGYSEFDFLGDFLAEFAEETREITFGPWNTKSLQIRLKDDWRDKVVEV